jgi:hypothetical protein
MSLTVRLQTATATKAVLAKIGNPQRDEPLQTSREVFTIDEKDQETLTAIFLKPFKNLIPHRFTHHANLQQHELNTCAKAIFESEDQLLPRGIEIAQRLYAKSSHPNIKTGDLCIAQLQEVHVEGQLVRGLCILKSDSVTPFLTITSRHGDLRLSTEHGIHPDKIDKGCLILDVWQEKGYYVLTFDRSGGDTRFWVREFLGVEPVADSAFLTNTYASMAVGFLEEKQAAASSEGEDDSPPWEAANAAADALSYFQDHERFELQDFEQSVLKTPEAIRDFQEHRTRLEEDHGRPLETSFDISQKDIAKAKKRLSAVLRLDSGVEIHIKPAATDEQPVLERGYDERKGMKFVKVFYHERIETT